MTTGTAAEEAGALLPGLAAALPGAPLLGGPLVLAGLVEVVLLLFALLSLLTRPATEGTPEVHGDGSEHSAVAACLAAVAKGDALAVSDRGKDTPRSDLPCLLAVTSLAATRVLAVSSHCTSAVASLSSATMVKAATAVVALFSVLCSSEEAA